MPDGSVGAAGMAGGAVGQVQSVFGGSVMGAAKSMIGGGGFEFSPEELDAVIQGWEDLLVEFQDDEEDINRAMGNLVPPAEDSSSLGFVDATRAGLEDLQASNLSMIKYVKDYLEKLRAAKAGNESAEAAASDSAGSFLKSLEA